MNNFDYCDNESNKLLRACAMAILLCCGSVCAMEKDSDLYSNSWANEASVSEKSTEKAKDQKDVRKLIQKLQEQLKEEKLKRERVEQENQKLENQVKELKQKIKTHENVLAETLDKFVYTKDRKVLKKEYDELIAAIKSNDIEKIKSLIKKDVYIDETVYNKFPTPLMIAIKEKHVDIVKFLLNNGADLKKSPEALESAVNTGNLELVKLLLNKGADPNSNGCSILILALKKGYPKIAKLFLSIPQNDRILDLIYAGKHKNPISDANIRSKTTFFEYYDTPDGLGNSPLMYAILSEQINDSDKIEIVKSLIKHKIDLNRVNNKQTALDLANQLKNKEIAKLLKNAGALGYSEIPPSKSPLAKLYEYCKDPSTDVNLSDLKFDFELTPEGRFNCRLTLKGREYNLHGNYASKQQAKNAIAEHVLRILEGPTQASSSRANQLSSSNSGRVMATNGSSKRASLSSINSYSSDFDSSDVATNGSSKRASLSSIDSYSSDSDSSDSDSSDSDSSDSDRSDSDSSDSDSSDSDSE